jgi:hypothetical protein
MIELNTQMTTCVASMESISRSHLIELQNINRISTQHIVRVDKPTSELESEGLSQPCMCSPPDTIKSSPEELFISDTTHSEVDAPETTHDHDINQEHKMSEAYVPFNLMGSVVEQFIDTIPMYVGVMSMPENRVVSDIHIEKLSTESDDFAECSFERLKLLAKQHGIPITKNVNGKTRLCKKTELITELKTKKSNS